MLAAPAAAPLLLLQFHLSKEKIVVVDTVGVVGVVGLGNLDDHVDLGDRGGLDGRGDVLVVDDVHDDRGDLGGDGGHDDHVDLGGRGDHGDLDEFDKEQPADVYDGGRGDVLVVDDVHDDRGDLGGEGGHDGHGVLGGDGGHDGHVDLGGDDVHDGHGDLDDGVHDDHGDLDDGVHDDRRGGHGDRKTLWITTYSSNERWECSWYAYWYSSRCSAYKCWDSCLHSSY